MKCFKYLYLSDSLEKKRKKIIEKVKNNKVPLFYYYLVIDLQNRNHLEIVSYLELLQPAYPKDHLLIVGVAKEYDEAVEIVESIALDALDIIECVDLKKFILYKEQEEEE